MEPDQLLQALGLSLGLPNLRFDGNGCARLAIDGAPALNFERTANSAIHIYSVLGPIPPDGREAIYTQLLEGNLFGTATASGSLALDPNYGEIVLCRTVMTELASGPMFSSIVEAFAAAAEDWQGRLNKPPETQAISGAITEPAHRMMDHFLRG